MALREYEKKKEEKKKEKENKKMLWRCNEDIFMTNTLYLKQVLYTEEENRIKRLVTTHN